MAVFLLRLVAETSQTQYALGLILSAFVLVLCAIRLTRVDPRIRNFVKSQRILLRFKNTGRKRRLEVAYPLRIIGETLWTYRILTLILPIIPPIMLLAATGTREDPRIRSILKSPSVLEKFKQANGVDPNDRRVEISPLVEQAQLLAQYLDPAPKVVQPVTPNVRPVIPAPSFTSYTAKFVLYGTCYYPSEPEESIALVWQPGGDGTLQWIKQGARLGHFVVEEIKRGSITYSSGGERHEMEVQRSPAQQNLVRGHRTDPSTASPEPEVLESFALNSKRILVEAAEEEDTAPK